MSLFHKKEQEQDINQSFRAKRKAILNEKSDFAVKEAYKTLRTNIRFSLRENGCHKICLTSALPGEGKSITTLNLAISFAETGLRVLLIDADLRRPTMARLLMESGDPGLSNILVGMCSEEEAIHKSQFPNLDVIFSGVIPPNPSEILGGPRMEALLERLSERYDYILIDTPPVNVVSDACIIAAMLDGVVFVVRGNKSERETVSRSVNRLNMAGVKLLGFVLNGTSGISNKKSYNNYYYSWNEEAQSKKPAPDAKPRRKA